MAKQSGLGDNLYVGGYDLSGDVGSLQTIAGRRAALDVTAIDKSAMERILGQADGEINFNCFFNDAALQEHAALSTLLTADRITTYFRGTTLGNPAAGIIGKQVNYDWNRSQDGALLGNVQVLGQGYALEWGRMLTAGKRTDTAATNGTSIDTTAAASFGAAAYLQVFAFTGTDVTVKIQDSADNAAFADVGLTFTQTTSAPGAQRIETALTATIRRYLRAVTVTTGGVTSVQFAVAVVKYDTLRGA